MSAKKSKGLKLPISPKILLDTITSTGTQSAKSIKISLVVDVSADPGFLLFAKEALRPLHTDVEIAPTPYFDEAVTVDSGSDLVIVLAASSPVTGDILLRALYAEVPVVIATDDPLETERVAFASNFDLDPRFMVTAADQVDDAAKRHASLFYELGHWMVRKLPDLKLSLARSLEFVREPLADDIIQSTSVQNGVVAAVFFLPGADMPILTLNQAKMLLMIAAAYDAEMSTQRLKELAVILASGFGLRAVARRLVGLVPVFGWAMRGAVGLTGTLAIGEAAKIYFEAGGNPAKIVKNLKPGKGAKRK